MEEKSSDTSITYSVGAYEYDIEDEALIKEIDAKYNFDDELIEVAYNWKGINEVLATMKEYFENGKVQNSNDTNSGNVFNGCDTDRERPVR